jgi:hypothetical protein
MIPRIERLEDRTVPSGGALVAQGTWTQVTRLIPDSQGAGTMEVLPDGTVMVQGGLPNQFWYRLKPDANGSYVNGTWTTLEPMSTQRLYFATNVLPNDKVLVVGGEYSGTSGFPTFTNTGEIYDVLTNTWTAIANFPQPQFGDDPSILLDNGLILYGFLAEPESYFYNPTAARIVDNGISVAPGAWAFAAPKLFNDRTDEETWVRLANGDILSYDIWTPTPTAQIYHQASNTWSATFLEDATTLGTSILAGGSATLSKSDFTVGNHTVTVRYSGDTNFNSSSSHAITQAVHKVRAQRA